MPESELDRLLAKLQAYRRDRLETLLSLDVEKMRAHLIRHSSDNKLVMKHLRTAAPSTLLMAMHKARVKMMDLPEPDRELSIAWLQERGIEP